MPDNWEGNSSFSTKVPRLQTSIDSTSLGEYKQCPRKYYYSIICGYRRRGPQVDLDFGSAAHRVPELFHKLRAEGMPYEEALEEVILNSLATTWNSEKQAPVFEDSSKNRLSLVRFAVEYLDRYEKAGTGPRTLMLENGEPAVELNFAFDSGIKVQGESVLLCGYIDRLVEINGEIFVFDIKTTREQLGSKFAKKFTPDNQFTLYTIAGQVAFGLLTKGLILDAAQIGTNFVRLERFIIPRPQGVLYEWMDGLHWWISQMMRSAEGADQYNAGRSFESSARTESFWPQNDKACGLYGGCQFREVCGRAPSARSTILNADFERRTWDPLGGRK